MTIDQFIELQIIGGNLPASFTQAQKDSDVEKFRQSYNAPSFDAWKQFIVDTNTNTGVLFSNMKLKDEIDYSEKRTWIILDQNDVEVARLDDPNYLDLFPA